MPTYQALKNVLEETLKKMDLPQIKEELAKMKEKYPEGNICIEVVEKELSKR
jgi:hypothetical protein